jgi:2-polyprenyl-6-methoxyphenol hydroxylase-like FAD-dependent oxidoreductase
LTTNSSATASLRSGASAEASASDLPGRVYWYCFETVPEGAPEPKRPRDEFLRRYGDWFDPIPALIESTDADAIEPTFTYDRPPRRTWGRGRVTLLGDAAHPMKPNIGQGAAQALEDAVVLGSCIAGSADPEQALRAYERGACDGRTPSSAPPARPDAPPRFAHRSSRECVISS